MILIIISGQFVKISFRDINIDFCVISSILGHPATGGELMVGMVVYKYFVGDIFDGFLATIFVW